MSESQTTQVAVLAKIPAAPGKRDELVAALQGALDTAQGEAGTTYYILHADAKDADVVWFYELYADQAAVDAHMGSEAFKAMGPVIGPFLGGRPELTFLTPLGGKGL
jgi:quinol monooxygenase YgiN